MDIETTLDAIKARAVALRLPLYRLCKEAGIAENSFWRWDKGQNQPSLTIIGKLEDTLSRLEKTKAAA